MLMLSEIAGTCQAGTCPIALHVIIILFATLCGGSILPIVSVELVAMFPNCFESG